MALKFTEKLKNIETPKVSVQSLLNRDKSDETTDNTELDEAKREIAEKLAVKTEELREKVSAFLVENGEKLKQWYSDNQMDEKIKSVAKKAGATIIYPVLLLYNLLNSPNVVAKDKMLIIAPLAYFILPADLIPDILLGAGYVDDGIAVMTALKTVSSSITPAITEQTKIMCKNLIGDADEEAIKGILDKVTQKLETEK